RRSACSTRRTSTRPGSRRRTRRATAPRTSRRTRSSGAWAEAMRVVGVDIGGTFTDLMLYDTASGSVHVHRVPSTGDAPERAMIGGLGELCAMAGLAPSDVTGVFHGTTIATNAVLEHEGAVAGMITSRAFRDIVHIGRHQRPLHYSVMQDIPWQARPIVLRRHRKVVSERVVPPTGEVLVPLDEDEVRAAARELRDEG